MGADQQTGTAILRSSFFDKVIKQTTERKYKFKQALSIDTTPAWKNYFYRESQTILTGGTGSAIRGIPRGAAYPKAYPQWERILTVIEKYGLETSIAWEDVISNDVDMIRRSLIKIADGVVKSVDDQIYADLIADSGIQSFTITLDKGWDGGSSALVDDLERAEQLIAEADYDTDDIMVFVNPRAKRSIVRYLTDKGAQWNNVAGDVLRNGKIGQIGSKTFIVSRSVTASQALVVVPKVCGSWKQLAPLTTNTEQRPGKDVLIWSFEMGVTQVHNPKTVVLIKGTEGGFSA